MVKAYPQVSEEYQKAVEKCKRKLRGLIAEKNCAPLMLRLAYALSLSLYISLSPFMGFHGFMFFFLGFADGIQLGLSM